jgi:hypothetical protein
VVSTARQTRLVKRAVPDGPTCRYCGPGTTRQPASRAGPGSTMTHLSILYNLAKKCVFVGTNSQLYKTLKHIHLASAAIVLLCYMLNSYT